ncbi:hypothetical protein KR026_011889, partial [Drosophila bipectinata]
SKKDKAGSQPPFDPVALRAIIDVLFPSSRAEGIRPAIENLEDESVEAVTAEEVLVAARNLASKKAPGPDAVPNRALKVVLAQIPEKVAAIYNQCLYEGSFPKVWKKQRLFLLMKPAKPPGEAASYRPICLLDTVGKVLEKILATRLQAAISRKGGLTEEQYGFRKGKSTEGTTIVGFADDIALVVVAKTVRGVETLTNSAVAKVEAWMSSAGLLLAPHKTEAVLISSQKKVETATVLVEGVAVTSRRAIKYLGVWLDTRLSFREHLE